MLRAHIILSELFPIHMSLLYKLSLHVNFATCVFSFVFVWFLVLFHCISLIMNFNHVLALLAAFTVSIQLIRASKIISLTQKIIYCMRLSNTWFSVSVISITYKNVELHSKADFDAILLIVEFRNQWIRVMTFPQCWLILREVCEQWNSNSLTKLQTDAVFIYSCSIISALFFHTLVKVS